MICPACNHNNHPNARFCSHCGGELSAPVYVATRDMGSITKTVVFFVVMVVFIVSLYFIDINSNYANIILANIVFSLIVLVFFAMDFRDTLNVLKFKDPEPMLMTALATGAPVFALGVFFFVDYLNKNIFDIYIISEYYLFIDSPAPLLLALISTAVFPAIFEEIAFRGVLFNMLEPFAGKTPTIFITAIMFSTIHFSLISLLWLFPIGLLFGYLRARHNTLWYGIIGHFLYNGSVVLYGVLLA